MPDIRVGISGWTYPSWRKTFYAVGRPQQRELAHTAGLLRTIEINGSFCALQKLRDVETPLANFFASGVLALEHKFGPVLCRVNAAFTRDCRAKAAFTQHAALCARLSGPSTTLNA